METRERLKTVGRASLDSKKRLSLTKALGELKTILSGNLEDVVFKIEVNEVGQILLTPEVTIAAHEAWLWKNQKALDSVRRGVKDAEEGRIVKRGSFKEFANEEID